MKNVWGSWIPSPNAFAAGTQPVVAGKRYKSQVGDVNGMDKEERMSRLTAEYQVMQAGQDQRVCRSLIPRFTSLWIPRCLGHHLVSLVRSESNEGSLGTILLLLCTT